MGMDGNPEPMKPEEQTTPQCGEEWCVAVGDCDGHCGTICATSTPVKVMWGTLQLDVCVECDEETNEPWWCEVCEIEAHCADCWAGCEC